VLVTPDAADPSHAPSSPGTPHRRVRTCAWPAVAVVAQPAAAAAAAASAYCPAGQAVQRRAPRSGGLPVERPGGQKPHCSSKAEVAAAAAATAEGMEVAPKPQQWLGSGGGQGQWGRRGGSVSRLEAGDHSERAPSAVATTRVRCVSIFLDKNRRYIGKSQSKRPPKRTQRTPHQPAPATRAPDRGARSAAACRHHPRSWRRQAEAARCRTSEAPIDAPCTQCLRHGDPMHAQE
jgi:hypothetical protein